MNETVAAVFNYKSIEYNYLFVEGEKNVLVIILHGYSQYARSMLHTWMHLNRDYGFSLLVPEGFHRSWNAEFCCGEALRDSLDDAGFIRNLTRAIKSEKFNTTAKVFVMGTSNGAFMTSKLALESLNNDGDDWIDGIAMISGYSYNDALYIGAQTQQKPARFPVLSLHGLADEFVRPVGCCVLNSCCCDIYTPECFPFTRSIQRWLEINQCAITTPTNETMRVDKFPFHNFPPALARNCYSSVGGMAEVNYCEFPTATHSLNFEVPDADVLVGDFFQFHAFAPTTAPTLSPFSIATLTPSQAAAVNSTTAFPTTAFPSTSFPTTYAPSTSQPTALKVTLSPTMDLKASSTYARAVVSILFLVFLLVLGCACAIRRRRMLAMRRREPSVYDVIASYDDV